jgi:Transglycosylase-like domain/Peptidase family M23
VPVPRISVFFGVLALAMAAVAGSSARAGDPPTPPPMPPSTTSTDGPTTTAVDCHADHSCPSSDHSYTWYDAGGEGWDCGSAVSEAADPEAQVIVYDGVSYVCYRTGSSTSTSTTTETTTTSTTRTKTEPPPPPPAPPTTRATKVEPPPRPLPLATPPRSSLPSALPPVQISPGKLDVKPTTAGYVFPVYGPVSFTDTFHAARADTGWHHGDDIFAPLGAPVLAVADGTVFSVGWNNVGGNRLWLRDKHGWEYYYAHLSAFTPQARNGAHVKAGTVLGFVGNTGDAAGTPYHLHFEIHPFSLLYLGYDGVIDPTKYLEAWHRLQDVTLTPADARFARAAGWALGGAGRAPEPGAVLLQSSDISSASGLDKGSLARAYAARLHIAEAMDRLRQSLEGATPDTGPQKLPAASSDSTELGSSEKAFGQDMLSFAGPLIWDVVAQCESGGDWSANTGNGYFGGLQFLPGTWARYGGYAFAASADGATREEQIAVAQRVLAVEGWDAWPDCSAKLGLR